jgi:endonuclease/exonuclease/phosphatase family metal-dependent hydrolase
MLSPDEIAVLRQRLPHEHRSLAAELPWLDIVECGGSASSAPASKLHIVAFNAERGTHFDAIVTLLHHEPHVGDADVLLLSEVDWGMARSGNRHVARDLATALGMTYAFGVEFLELTKGDAMEAAVAGENTKSLHGNAILSRFPLIEPRLIRLPPKCDWKEPEQARIGGRMALAADIETAAGRVTLATVHLENRTSPQGRCEQMAAVIDALADSPRAVVAGDLNTSTIDPDDPSQLFSIPDLLRDDPKRLVRPQAHEPLFADMRAAGFMVEEVNEADVPTSVPMGIEDRSFWLKLDWMFARGLRVVGVPKVVEARTAGRRVSDHDVLVAELALGSEALMP